MKRAFLVAGLGYGDEGKGATVDFLVRKYQVPLVVRYNGGPQAAHNVVTDDGRHHTFSQWGSGTFVPGCETFLSCYMLVNPSNMFREQDPLYRSGVRDGLSRMIVSEDAVIITPFHVALNRVTAQGNNTCGQGIGKARQDHLDYGDAVLFAKDTWSITRMREKLAFLQERAMAVAYLPDALRDAAVIERIAVEYRQWARLIRIAPDAIIAERESVVFEGAQGALLDEVHGEQGFNTWSDCTFGNALRLINETGRDCENTRIGVLRTYHTRHGDGPFQSEDGALSYLEPHNDDCGYQGKFRLGHFDMDLARKGISIIGGVDGIALNHQDVCHPEIREFEENIGAKVMINGYGPRATDRTMVE